MAASFKVPCPHCRKSLVFDHEIRVGKKIRCSYCDSTFHMPDPSVPVALGIAAPPHQPDRPSTGPHRGRVAPGRLLVALGGVMLYLVGGALLGWYCFDLNAKQQTAKNDEPHLQAPTDDDPDPLAPIPVASSLRPATGIDLKQQKIINDAIVKGVWYLRDHLQPNGAWGKDFIDRPNVTVGFASLPGLTLLECGALPSDPIIQKAAALVRSDVLAIDPAENYGGSSTYQKALAILFLDRLGDKKDEALIQYLALCLIAGQHPTEGAWAYTCPPLDRTSTPQLLNLLSDPKHSLEDWRNTALKGQAFPVTSWDNSNTQFAILGLWAAQRHHVPIDRSVALIEKHFRTTQQPQGPDPSGHNVDLDGSWNYYDNPQSGCPWPSMTCSGLLGLAVAHGTTKDPKEKKQKPLDDPAIKRGLAMVSREIGREGEARPRDQYYLWSLERVGVLYNLQTIDGKDWYTWGCQALLPAQQDDGSWADGAWYGNSPVLNTCFALLFLKRANLVQDLTNKLQLLDKNAK